MGQRQAALFDLGPRSFYSFGLVLYPPDFMYLTGILVISVYLLVLYIAVAGRLWCGCAGPQSVRTEIFLWLEKLTDGELSVRMRRAPGVWTAERIVRKAAEQVL